MRNLQLHSFYRLPTGADNSLPAALANLTDARLVIDQNNAHVAYVVGVDPSSRSSVVHRIDSVDGSVRPLLTDDSLDGERIVDAEHLMLNDELSLVAESGRLLAVDLRSGSVATAHTLAFDGVRCSAWSPDQEALAIVTADGTLTVLNAMYDPVAECALNAGGFGDGAFVSVGWGSKATQFHGTAGKEARFRNVDEPAEANDADLEHRRNSIDIVWRGDSELFAVYLPRAEDSGAGEREFKVFSKEGALRYTTERSPALGAPIAWRPSGQWLAVPQQLAGKYVLALFEKNGLKHREIELPFGSAEERVHRLEWSADSAVLAVETRLPVGEQRSRIYLYAINNYHWYQKQTLEFDGCVAHFKWDPSGMDDSDGGDRLHVLTAGGRYVRYRWVWTVNASRTLTADDEAIVAVIDGRQLLLTGFRGQIVPPPMCSKAVTFERHVNRVEFVSFGDAEHSGNRFAAIDAAGALHLYECRAVDGRLSDVRLVRTYEGASEVDVPLATSHWLFLSGSLLVHGSEAADEGGVRLTLCEMSAVGALIVRWQLRVAGRLQHLAGVAATEFAVLTSEGLFRVRTEGTVSAESGFDVLRGTLVDQLCVARGGRDVFGLKPKQWLSHNGRVVTRAEVTSMVLAEQYLLYTTIDRLHFVRLQDGQVVGERRCERGARLVVSVAQNARTVLQMPRGNLEAIQPRVLSLCIIGRRLDEGEFRAAFDDMCKQRINLNLVVDHDPQAFYGRVADFVRAIGNAHWLNLFLSDLDGRDVSVEMYGSNYPERRADANVGGKIERVCELVRETIDALGLRGTLLLPVLTSYVKTGRLERALEIVWQLKRDESGPPAEDAVTANAALTYLLYLVDVNVLYNVALGMYDFDIVRFVAGKSQKDPKEYLPFLARLEQIADVSYRRYQVDVHLKRWTRAVDNLLACEDDRVEELLDLCVRQGLYAHALRHFEGGPLADGECARSIAGRYAEHLRETGNLRDACLMYERSGDFGQALLSAKNIGDWMKCLQMSRRLEQSDEERLTLIGQLIPTMMETGNHASAAQLIIEHQRDFAQAVQILCDGNLYNDAIHIGRMHDESLIDSLVRPQAIDHAGTLCSIIASDEQTFVEHKTRLLVVRQERAKRRQADDDGLDETMADLDLDTFSDTSSGRGSSTRLSTSSRGTGKTHKSSKNRRKHERKLLSLKPGNPFEEIALIDALHSLAHKAYAHQSVVRAACKALIDLRADADARRVQTALVALLRTVQDSLAAIWTAELIVAEERSLVPDASAAPIDLAHLQRDQLYAMIKPHQRYKPDLKVLDWQFQVLQH